MTSTASIAPDKGEAADQADAAFDQLCALLRDAPDLTPMAIGHWTAREVAGPPPRCAAWPATRG